MIQHIRNYKYLLIYLFIYLFIGCKKEKNNNLAYNTNTQNKLNLNGTWYCHDFSRDNRINTRYSVSFAEENGLYSNFRIKNDSIFFGNCFEKIYKYSYSLKKKKHDEESVFVTHFKPQKKTVNFFTIENKNSCIPIESPIFYIKNNNEVVVLDRGYFFSYKNEKKNSLPYSVIGIPGNNREYWEVKGVYMNLSINAAYNSFLNEFKYGSENLLKNIPTKNYIDKQHSIEYKLENDRLIIEKSDPMGIIFIEFNESNDNTSFIYRLDYPEY